MPQWLTLASPEPRLSLEQMGLNPRFIIYIFIKNSGAEDFEEISYIFVRNSYENHEKDQLHYYYYPTRVLWHASDLPFSAASEAGNRC